MHVWVMITPVVHCLFLLNSTFAKSDIKNTTYVCFVMSNEMFEKLFVTE